MLCALFNLHIVVIAHITKHITHFVEVGALKIDFLLVFNWRSRTTLNPPKTGQKRDNLIFFKRFLHCLAMRSKISKSEQKLSLGSLALIQP